MSSRRQLFAVSAVVVVAITALLGSWFGDDETELPAGQPIDAPAGPQTGGSPAGAQPAPDESMTPVRGTLTVLAAASLTEAFEDLADRLAERYPDLEIVYSFGPSSGLAQQVLAGAPADVLVTADTETMDAVVEAGATDGAPRVIARNTMTLVTPPDDPGRVSGLADLARRDLRVAICEPQVPCGSAAQTLLAEAGVDAAPDTLATDVKDALSLVTLGEVDAALVYQTDTVAVGGAVRVVAVAQTESVVNDYPAVVLADARNLEAARAFVDALTSELGRSALTAAGFVDP